MCSHLTSSLPTPITFGISLTALVPVVFPPTVAVRSIYHRSPPLPWGVPGSRRGSSYFPARPGGTLFRPRSPTVAEAPRPPRAIPSSSRRSPWADPGPWLPRLLEASTPRGPSPRVPDPESQTWASAVPARRGPTPRLSPNALGRGPQVQRPSSYPGPRAPAPAPRAPQPGPGARRRGVDPSPSS